MDMKLLDKDFFRRDVLCVAPDLTGRVRVRRLDDGALRAGDGHVRRHRLCCAGGSGTAVALEMRRAGEMRFL